MWDCARDWAQIAPGFTPLIAVAAVLLAWQQLILNRKNQRETIAKATFREFLKLCVQHADLAYGKPKPETREEYEWFVGYFLWAAEEILEYSSSKTWDDNLRLHVTYHKDYLKNDQKFRVEDFPVYSAAVQNLIVGVVGSIPKTASK